MSTRDSRSPRTGSSRPRPAPRAASCRRTSKKLSSTPSRSALSTAGQFLGDPTLDVVARRPVGSARAGRSGIGQPVTVHLAVRGQRERRRGTSRPQAPCSQAGSWRRTPSPLRGQLAGRHRPARSRRRSADGPAPPVPTATTAAARRGGPRSTFSISPSSMRWPCTFTWWSRRPRNSSSPVGAPAHQVARPVEAAAGLAGRTGRGRSARRSEPGRPR